MAGPATAANDLARRQLYLGSAKRGVVFNRAFNFYSGNPTSTSFTGNLILGMSSDGPGASLINGIGPVPQNLLPCDVLTIVSLNVVIGVDNVFITVEYNSLPDDIYQLFSSNGNSYTPISVTPVGLTLVLMFADIDDLSVGTYHLKIMRAADPANCFTIRRNLVTVTCPLILTTFSGDGVLPNPALTMGDSGTILVTGVGFLLGTITAEMPKVLGLPGPPVPPGPPCTIDLITIMNDTTLTIDFTTPGADFGSYGVILTLDSDPLCTASLGFSLPDPRVIVLFA